MSKAKGSEEEKTSAEHNSRELNSSPAADQTNSSNKKAGTR